MTKSKHHRDTSGSEENRNANEQMGGQIYDLICELFPICRSITGPGVRQSFEILKRLLPLRIHEVPTGTKVFDWIVPKEWSIRDAYIIDPQGHKIVDFKQNNLHVLGYSIPVKKTLSRKALDRHLYSLPDQPEAIPYITSYYRERWGFCLSQRQREALPSGEYQVCIDSTLTDGSLTYGDLLIKGASSKEILLSAYICHPSMANDSLSGVGVATYLGRWLAEQTNLRYSYRIVIIPETIGSIVYLRKNIKEMRENTLAGFVLTCCGDDRVYSLLPSRLGNTLADKVAQHVLEYKAPGFIHYSFLDRGSDERQYCSPGVDLPIASILRSKYGEFSEYHTSEDDLSLISPKGLGGTFDALSKCITAIEKNRTYKVTVQCEPQLGKRGLYPTVSKKGSTLQVKNIIDLLTYCDGSHDLIDIANRIKTPVWELYDIVDKLVASNLIIEA